MAIYNHAPTGMFVAAAKDGELDKAVREWMDYVIPLGSVEPQHTHTNIEINKIRQAFSAILTSQERIRQEGFEAGKKAQLEDLHAEIERLEAIVAAANTPVVHEHKWVYYDHSKYHSVFCEGCARTKKLPDFED